MFSSFFYTSNVNFDATEKRKKRKERKEKKKAAVKDSNSSMNLTSLVKQQWTVVLQLFLDMNTSHCNKPIVHNVENKI